MFIRDVVVEALESRLLGAAEFHSTCNALDRALQVQFRMHYHIGTSAGVTEAVGKVLLGEIDKVEMLSRRFPLDKPLIDLINKILSNCEGIIQFYMGQFQRAGELLRLARKVELEKTFEEFDMYLGLENLYYTASLKQNDSQISEYLYENLFKVLSFVPSESQALSHQCLWMIAKRLQGHNNLENLSKRWTGENKALIYLVSIIASPKDDIAYSNFTKENDARFLQYGNSLVESIKFPKASQSNSYELEQFMLFLQVYFKNVVGDNIVSKEWYNFIVKAMSKTFQSINVAKTALFLIRKISPEGDSKKLKDFRKEALLNFVNFIKYSEKEFKLNKKYDDIVSMLVCYNFTLNSFGEKDNIENLFDYDQATERLLELLIYFYKEHNIPLSDKKQSLDILENPVRLAFPTHVANTLSQSWLTLYHLRINNVETLLSYDLLAYLANCVPIAKSMSEGLYTSTVFQYALTLARQRNIETAIKVLENLILEKRPNYYKAWHLLALCHSTKEDKETSYKIVCSVLEAMKENVDTLSIRDKFQFVYMKLTQLRIIKEMFGNPETLELVPEVFELYRSLFSNINDSKIKTENTSCNKDRLLKDIWLFVSAIYMEKDSTQDLDEAETAIKEAFEANKSTISSDCLSARAHLKIKQGNHVAALRDVEHAIDINPNDVGALIGFAQLIFDEVDDDCQDPLKSYYKLTPQNMSKKNNENDESKSIFFNVTDRSAATARLKLLLDCTVSSSPDAYHSPEIWWYLSQIHERLATREYKDCLMNCVRFEELKPISPLEYCNY
ncbi:Cargo-transport protein YPP1 [Nakaseomyces bracarensis]|uniref:Cargo-transport protein YPP1 n=1 Tax=Nakaseomyces bracarensis TaxID=273131 RepID=A0ABR4NWD2_9SACH